MDDAGTKKHKSKGGGVGRHLRRLSLSLTGSKVSALLEDEAAKAAAPGPDASSSASPSSSKGHSRRHSYTASTVDAEQIRKDIAAAQSEVLQSQPSSTLQRAKHRAKTTVVMSFEIVRVTSLAADGAVHVEWKQGSKTENAGHSAEANEQSDGAAAWSPAAALQLRCSFKRDGTQRYESKTLALTLKQLKRKKHSTIGKGLLELSELVANDVAVPKEIELPLSKQGKPGPVLLLRLLSLERLDSDASPAPSRKRSSSSASSSSSSTSSASSAKAATTVPVKILLKMRPTRAQDLEPRTDDTMISMEFDLGSKGLGRFTKSKSKSADESSGSKESAMAICRSGAVMWEPNDPPVELSCHVQLDQATNTVQPRSLKLRLKSCSWAYAKTSTLGTLKIDMAAYATHEFSDLCVFRFKNKDPSRAAEAAVELEIWCRWEKLNHKQIVAVNSADSSDGKPDFDLATCDDDLSEATAAGGGASDSDEELDDLESDAHTTTTTSSEDATHTEPSSGTSPARTDGHQDSRTNDREATDATATATATATASTTATTPTTPSRSSLAYSRGSILESTPTRTTTPPATASFEVTSKLQRLESENTWLQSQLDQLQEQLQKQEHELERLREHAREAELLKAQIASLMQEVANANANAKASSSSSSSSSSKRKSKQIDSVLEGVTKQRLMAAEKRVHELERQVEDLEKEKRSSERANASAAAASSDVAALQREITELQAQLRRYATSQPADARAGTPSEDEAALTGQELRVFEAIYQSALEYAETSEGGLLPAPVAAALPILVQRGVVKMRPFNRVLDAITSCIKVAGTDRNSLCYWLGTSLVMLQEMQAADIGFSGDVELNGVIHPPPAPPPGSGATSCEYFLNQLIHHAYQTLVNDVANELQGLLEPAVFEQDIAIMQYDRPLPFQLGWVTMDHITQRLSTVLELFQRHQIPHKVRRQFFHQIAHFIVAYLLNQVLQRKALCTAHIGFQIKMSVSILDAWFLEHRRLIGNASYHMETLIQAANVLTLATNVEIFKTTESIESTFSRLSPAQIKKMIDLYHPDALAPEPLPPSVRSMVTKVAAFSNDTRLLLDSVLPLVEIDNVPHIDEED